VFRRCERSLLVGKRHRTMRHVPSFNSRQTANGTCADHRCIRVQAYHGGLTPPALGLYMRLCIAKVAISPAHVRACNQERRASARRGWRKRTCSNAAAKSRETAGAMLTNAGAGALANHGGLTPPALGLYMHLCIGKVAILSAQDGLVLSDLRSIFSEQGSLLVHSVSCACHGSSKVRVHPGFRTISAIRPVTAHGRRAFEQVTLPDLSDASMPPNPCCRVQGRG
jgi:hypothetical protein